MGLAEKNPNGPIWLLIRPPPFSENTVAMSKSLPLSLPKSDRFSKNHIYSGRGDFSASSYAKNSTSIFFQKIGFSEEGVPLSLMRKRK